MTPDANRPLLILGGSGFLGVPLVEAASRSGEVGEVVSASRQRLPEGCALEGAVTQRRVDALVADEVETLLEELRPAAVILVAALARVADCARYPGLAEALNVGLPERVARRCHALGIRLVHVSTDLVFGGRPPTDGVGYREQDPPAPVHPYGRTKAEGEERVFGAAPGALVARLPLLYGDARGRGLGASASLLQAVREGERPALFTDEWRTPLDVDDAARALVELAMTPQDGAGGILHVAGPRRLSRLELGLEVLRAAGLDDDEARAQVRSCRRADLGLEERPADVSLDAARARERLTSPLRAPEEALASRAP